MKSVKSYWGLILEIWDLGCLEVFLSYIDIVCKGIWEVNGSEF